MISRLIRRRSSGRRGVALAIVFGVGVLSAVGCDDEAASVESSSIDSGIGRADSTGGQDGAGTQVEPAATGGLEDQPIETARLELLDLAFANASKFPLAPYRTHLKNRSTLQAEVAEVALELGQPSRALRYAKEIANWRRGLVIAQALYYGVQHGEVDGLEPMVARASEIADAVLEAENPLAWRRDRIRMELAKVFIHLGDGVRALEFEAGADPSEAGKANIARSRISTVEMVDQQLGHVEEVIEVGTLDPIINNVGALVELYRRHYENDSIRTRITSVLTNWFDQDQQPPQLTVESAIGLASVAAGNGDSVRASGWLDRAQKPLDNLAWSAELGIEMQAKIAAERYRIGESDAARRLLETSVGRYDEVRDLITDMDRSGALRWCAEAYVVGGELARASVLYERAIDEAFVNPNSRPRCFDLVRIALSWARTGFVPGRDLAALLEKRFANLGDPW